MATSSIKRKAYDGEFTIEHNPEAKGRQPRYTVTHAVSDFKETPIGVTSLMSSVLAKDFVGWALKLTKDHLYQVLTNRGTVDFDDIDDGIGASAKKRDSGAGTGTMVHGLIEAHLKGAEGYSTETITKEAALAYGAWVEWFEKTKPKVLEVEQVIYSMTSHYAGCFDAMLEIKGKSVLADWKTTNASKDAPQGVYAENFIQLGLYAAALLEEYGKAPDDLMVVSVRKDGKLDTLCASELGLTVDDCMELGYHVVRVYEVLQRVKKLIRGGK